jgi:hypothetical protein
MGLLMTALDGENSSLRGSRSERTPLNLFTDLVEFLHFRVVQHFSGSIREHAGKLLPQFLVGAGIKVCP